jgi:hypothetical protein
MVLFDALAELFAEFSLDGFVALGASFVDVDFPADAAGVGAFAGDATERIVKIRCSENHAVKFRNDVPILLSNKKLT